MLAETWLFWALKTENRQPLSKSVKPLAVKNQP